MNVRNWSFSYNAGEKKVVKQNILDTITLWGSIGLLWASFVSILGELFSTYTSDLKWWAISLYVLVLWFAYDWPQKYLKRAAGVCRILGMLIPVAFIMMQLNAVLDGLVSVANTYLPYLNYYYKTSFYLPVEGSIENQGVAFTAISMLIWGLVWFLAYGWKKRILLVLFPVLALAVELFVGLSPAGNGLLLAFVAAIFILTLGSTSIVRRGIALVCVCASVVLAGTWFKTDIEDLASRETKQNLLRWQNNLNLDSFNIFKMFSIDMHFNQEQLNNNMPQYTGKTVLEIQTSEKPYDTVYLKGFYATNYENGNWIYDDSALREACQEAGKSQSEVAKQIFQMPYECRTDDEWTTYTINYTIYYTGATGDVAYVPYLSDYNSLDQKYTFIGDYLLKKSIVDNTITVSAVWGSADAESWKTENGLSNDSFINELANAYMQLPEDTAYLEEARREIIYAAYSQVNLSRITKAGAVKEYLAQQMSYSLKLDALPNGADPVEYALTESHEGYCMHFASAATLLLRELGVPARYVSGYAVERTEFVKDEETGTYKAQVGDYMAHAWVEIYLDDIGWVPVEVTPGASLENVPSSGEIQTWESESNRHRQELLDQEQDDSTEDDGQDTQSSETENDNSEDETSEDPAPSESESQENPQNRPGNTGSNQDIQQWVKIGKWIAVVAAIGAFIFAAFVFAKKQISNHENKLREIVEKRMTRKAVNIINRRMYRRLCLAKPKSWFGKKWNDQEYQRALTENFGAVSAEDWEKYMEIVKKNHYSKEVITIEEMQFCYDCYIACKHKKCRKG